jgi:FKBP-type peptidyl-prolyl cis-trans isomerase (trigger factor)
MSSSGSHFYNYIRNNGAVLAVLALVPGVRVNNSCVGIFAYILYNKYIMKIKTQKREGNKVFIEVEEDYSSFEQAVKTALAKAAKDMKIPGFRPGKAPANLVEKAIDREALEAHAAQDLISDLYPKVIDEAKIDPVDYPNVEIAQLKKDLPFEFKIAVDVYPEVKLGKYKGIKADKIEVKVSDEDVIEVLGNINQRVSKLDADGKPELMPLDDEFAKKVSRFGTLAELKEEIREAMLKDKTAQSDSDLKNKLIAEVASSAKVDIPPGMVEREINIMLDELESSLIQSNLSLEDYLKGIKKEEKQLRDELRKSAEIRVKGKVVLRAVADEEKIELSEEEMKEEMQNLAKSSGEKVEDLTKRLDSGARKYIEDYMLRRKALDLVMEKAKINLIEPPKKKEEQKS